MNPLRPLVVYATRSKATGAWVAAGSLCLMSLLILLVLMGRSPGVHPPESTGVELSRLTLRDGRLYLQGATDPFSGVALDHYPDGTQKSRSLVVKGKLHGISEGWATNAQLVVRECFREGVSHGIRTKWYPSGRLLSEATIVEGKLHGSFQRWHENGVVAEVIPMKHDSPDGQLRSYYPNGSPKALVAMSNGVILSRTDWKEGEGREVAVNASKPN